jgi:hypothetical protein
VLCIDRVSLSVSIRRSPSHRHCAGSIQSGSPKGQPADIDLLRLRLVPETASGSRLLSSALVCPVSIDKVFFQISRAGRARHRPKQYPSLGGSQNSVHRQRLTVIKCQARRDPASPNHPPVVEHRAEARISPCKLLLSAAPRPSVLSPSVSSKLWLRHHEPLASFLINKVIQSVSQSVGSSEERQGS